MTELNMTAAEGIHTWINAYMSMLGQVLWRVYQFPVSALNDISTAQQQPDSIARSVRATYHAHTAQDGQSVIAVIQLRLRLPRIGRR